MVGALTPRRRVAWDYLRGGSAGRGRCGRRGGPRRAPRRGRAVPGPAGVARPGVERAGRIGRRDHPPGPRSLSAASPRWRRSSRGGQIEVVLVDDSADGRASCRSGGLPCAASRPAALAPPAPATPARVRPGGAAAVPRRRPGARAELVERHLAGASRRGADAVVIGYSPPRRGTRSPQAAALWWEGHFRAKLEMAAPTFVEVLSGNMSVPRELFERVGGSTPAFGRIAARTGSVRVLQAGARVRYEPGAVAEHGSTWTGRGRIAAARAEGRGDALLVERYPFAQGYRSRSRSTRCRGVCADGSGCAC